MSRYFVQYATSCHAVPNLESFPTPPCRPSTAIPQLSPSPGAQSHRQCGQGRSRSPTGRERAPKVWKMTTPLLSRLKHNGSWPAQSPTVVKKPARPAGHKCTFCAGQTDCMFSRQSTVHRSRCIRYDEQTGSKSGVGKRAAQKFNTPRG